MAENNALRSQFATSENESYLRFQIGISKNEQNLRSQFVTSSWVYHFGASLKDLGKKWFAFSKIDKDAFKLLERLAGVISES